MAYQALYRKYRPNSFNDFIDQDSIKTILVNSIKNNKISHAYLFSGPRGIGKTSLAKIFAKAINCQRFTGNDVCNECDNCIEANNNSVDIIEIDAASNNGVDQIRDLKNKISIVPSSLKYKVYIIDEVHMLTNSAFNALLKTLEEPPSYVVFILATTEFYEVPETIVSRCQCFNFNRISIDSMVKRLKYISKEEKISIDDDVIEEIAHYANGGLRDAIGMLDKLRSFSSKKITIDIYKNLNGVISQEEIIKFYNYIFQNDYINVLDMIDRISKQGYDFKNLIERLMIYVRDKIILYYKDNISVCGSINQNVDLVSILNDILNRIKDSINPMVIVQVYLLKYMDSISIKKVDFDENNISQEIKSVTLHQIKVDEKEKENNYNTNLVIDKNYSDIIVNEENKKIRINNAMATADLSLKKELLKKWSELSTHFMDEKYGKIAQLLSDTEPMVVGTNYMILTVESDGIINNIYSNLLDVESFISKFYHPLYIVLLSNQEFTEIKEKYIEDRKNNIVYHEQEECGKLVNEKSNLANQAISLFGEDLVDLE